MALFAGRPEEPTEWAGLPSEPRDPQQDDELAEPVPTDVLGLATGTGLTSVPIEIPEPGTATAAEPEARATPGTDADESKR